MGSILTMQTNVLFFFSLSPSLPPSEPSLHASLLQCFHLSILAAWERMWATGRDRSLKHRTQLALADLLTSVKEVHHAEPLSCRKHALRIRWGLTVPLNAAHKPDPCCSSQPRSPAQGPTAAVTGSRKNHDSKQESLGFERTDTITAPGVSYDL